MEKKITIILLALIVAAIYTAITVSGAMPAVMNGLSNLINSI